MGKQETYADLKVVRNREYRPRTQELQLDAATIVSRCLADANMPYSTQVVQVTRGK